MKFQEIFKALADENRLRIINLLRQGELCVCEIESILRMSQSNTSRHLNILKSLNIIDAEKKAQWVYYFLNEDFIANNKKLYDYLFEQLTADTYKKDIDRLTKYRSSTFSCENFNEEKEDVLSFLDKICDDEK
ncbi:MAG: metalloregulator ArsR/SmtB family transcription factor [Bacillota bacterium]|nr:metalloregulator ArsR/SmtB family transcription factor [Bacillota bacterium]